MTHIKVIWRARRGTFVVRYYNPERDSWTERSANTTDRQTAERFAGRIAVQLEEGTVPKTRLQAKQSHVPKCPLSWERLAQRYRDE